ncbi:MAG: glycosyltransferase [Acetobacteraceae bacterium]
MPEDEIGELIAWSDAIVLPYREASQSGVAPAAIAAGRFVVSTQVGGLVEQLRDTPMATLCEPDAPSLTTALRELIDAPARPEAPPVDPRLAWRDMARQLLTKVPPHAGSHHRRP